MGWRAIMANESARIIVMTRKKMFKPQSLPDGLNHIKSSPETVNAAM